MEDIKVIKEKFERGEIQQEEMDIETQKKIANLYKEEMQSIMDEIVKVRKETKMYDEKIKELDKLEKQLNEN